MPVFNLKTRFGRPTRVGETDTEPRHWVTSRKEQYSLTEPKIQAVIGQVSSGKKGKTGLTVLSVGVVNEWVSWLGAFSAGSQRLSNIVAHKRAMR